MIRQFAIDREIERSEAEAGAIQRVVRLTTTRVEMYMTVRFVSAYV